MIPVGDLLAHLGAWTDVPGADAARDDARRGAGIGGRVGRARAAHRRDRRTTRRTARCSTPTATPARRSRSCARSTAMSVAAMSEYLDLVGCRLLDGFDISGRYALELPDALLRSIRSSVDGRDERHAPTSTRASPTSARRCPTQHRAEFDELLGEARLMYRLRDERGVFSDIWASGIMRRAALAAGRRLQGRGGVHDAEHFVDAGFDEMCALVTGTGGPSADELAQRFADRSAHTAKEAPPSLWRPPAPPPPDPSGLPPGVRAGHARGRHRDGGAVRQLGGAARGEPAARARRQWRCLRRTGPARLGPDRVRSHRAGRRARHRVDDRGVQHPVAAARRDRHRQRRVCSRTRRSSRASTASPAWSGRATRPTAFPTARACAWTATPVK